ncbi:Fusaric acid resistance protein family protein [compost metagenome]
MVSQVILPQVNGFPLLCLAMGVPLFFGTLGIAHRPSAGVATPFTLNTIALIAPQNVMHFDTAAFFNEALAMLVAVGGAVLAYQLIGLRDPYWHGRRLIGAGLDDLRRLTQRSLAGSDLWFAGRMADRLLQLARHGAKLPEAQRQRWDNGVALLDLGDELLHLRIALHKAGLSQRRIEGLLQQLAPALAQPPAAERAYAFDQPCRTLLEALQGMLSSDDQKLAETAVLQLQNSWRRWCMQQREANHGVA